jgi:nicotinamidase/pyrazinamidase
MVTKILLIVDPQNDFITGSLAVKGAKKKMMKLSDNTLFNGYDYICITLDSHPKDHCSFKENGGSWPRHCVSYTAGWELPGYLNDALNYTSRSIVAAYHKGDVADREEYSIFDNWEDGLTLTKQIMDLCKEGEVYFDVCGIAGDYCVLETLKGLLQFVSPRYVKVLTQYTASIDSGEKLMNFIKENNLNYE